MVGQKGSGKFQIVLPQGLPSIPKHMILKRWLLHSEEGTTSVTTQNVSRIMAPRVSPNSSNVLSSGEDMKKLFIFIHYLGQKVALLVLVA